MVKITYDPSIETEEDFAAKLKEQQTALENLGKQKVDLKAKVDKLTADPQGRLQAAVTSGTTTTRPVDDRSRRHQLRVSEITAG
ncbi:MAG: hypothetical protein IPF53_15865 [Blastocatellia bacterium]|nr:hypothetical protein [Blastocatellia bacterium]